MRVFVILCIIGACACVGYVMYRQIENPYSEREAKLRDDLSNVVAPEVTYVTTSDVDYRALQEEILAKPALFRELIPPPPPPPPAPPAPPPKPNLAKMLEGVIATKATITKNGQPAAKIRTAADPRGDFKGVGEVINGVTIKEITDEEVIFSLTANEKEYTHTLKRQ